MAEYLQFKPAEVIVTQAVESKEYDKLWMASMVVDAPHPLEQANLTATFYPYRISNGVPEVDMERPIAIRMYDLFGKAATEESLAATMNAVFQEIINYGIEVGQLKGD